MDGTGLTAARSGLLAILVTDIVDSTAHRVRLGDAVATPLFAELDAASTGAVLRRSGSVVVGTGDGLVATFPSASEALLAALDAHRLASEVGERAGVALAIRAVVDVGDVDVTTGRLEGPVVERANAVIDAIRDDAVVCTDAARSLAAHAEVRYAPGPLDGTASVLP